ncbi:hypothetical protein BZG74_03610 [Salinivibrio sharmensis]|uniref:Uncharacterized protein n=1 Tax=Salinivibrio sharmensis TaxID=390883 RepID=A0ABX3KJM9_9GAMM|nr:hypothetical protein BZG74_03610 [Salinivibrio sharmensis]
MKQLLHLFYWLDASLSHPRHPVKHSDQAHNLALKLPLSLELTDTFELFFSEESLSISIY